MEAPSEPTQAHACARFDGNCALQARDFVFVSSLEALGVSEAAPGQHAKSGDGNLTRQQ
jgi:hypothetical protein